MRGLSGFRIAADRREVNISAVKLRSILSPKLFHGQHMFPCLSPPMIEIRTHNLTLFPEPAGADTEDEPPIRTEVQSGDLLSQIKGIMLGHKADRGTKF